MFASACGLRVWEHSIPSLDVSGGEREERGFGTGPLYDCRAFGFIERGETIGNIERESKQARIARRDRRRDRL